MIDEKSDPSVLCDVVQVAVIKFFGDFNDTSKDDQVILMQHSRVTSSLLGSALRVEWLEQCPSLRCDLKPPEVVQLRIFIILATENIQAALMAVSSVTCTWFGNWSSRVSWLEK